MSASHATWRHRTNSGRVVYSTKPSVFTGRDVLRILTSLWFKAWSWVETDFRELVFEILRLAARAAAQNSMRVMLWAGDLIRRFMEFLWNLVTFDNADDAYVLAQTLLDLSKDWKELAQGWGGGPAVASRPDPWKIP